MIVVSMKVAGSVVFGFGALFGWAVTGDAAEKKLREKNDVIAKLEAENDKLALDGPRRTKTERPVFQEPPVFDPESEETVEEVRTNLQRLISEYTDSPDAAEEYAQLAAEEVSVEHDQPFVIGREVYAFDPEEGDNFAKITLTYYARDQILLDEDDELIEQPSINGLVGWKNLRRFGDDSGDPDVVFVRNRRLSSDFEVVRDTERELPTHIRYGLSKAEFELGKASGVLKLRLEDM